MRKCGQNTCVIIKDYLKNINTVNNHLQANNPVLKTDEDLNKHFTKGDDI